MSRYMIENGDDELAGPFSYLSASSGRGIAFYRTAPHPLCGSCTAVHNKVNRGGDIDGIFERPSSSSSKVHSIQLQGRAEDAGCTG
jgi:hypothetical protein